MDVRWLCVQTVAARLSMTLSGTMESLMKLFAAVFAASALLTAPVLATPCRDGKGKFIKCASATSAKPKRCKDAKGKFVKCTAAGAKPA